MKKRIRTKEEILARIEERQKVDLFAWEWVEYLKALTKQEMEEHARGTLIKEDADLKKWKPTLFTDKQIRNHCKEYMPFAWRKANNCRGLSANRSIMHFTAWMWLLGEDDWDDMLDNYEYYGKPQLVRICKFLELDYTQWDDGKRSNTEY